MTERSRILVIDDDADVNATLADLLSPSFEVLTALSGPQGIQIAREQKPELILLDLNMPQMNGFTVCNQLRTQQDTQGIPIVVLSGNDDRESRTRAFQMGADDFLGKPFDHRELVARIQSKLRRETEKNRSRSTVQVGNLVLDQERIEVRVEQQLIPLSALEFKLLWFFVENVNRLLTRDEILKTIWGGCHVIDRTVDTHIAYIRKKIPHSTFQITTIYGAGYIFKSSTARPAAPALN